MSNLPKPFRIGGRVVESLDSDASEGADAFRRPLVVKAQDVVHPGIRGKLVVRNISRSHGGTRDERT
jgi:hypothetical protein